MAALGAPSTDEVSRFTRTLDKTSSLPGGIMSPSAGVRPVKLRSLREVDAFLVSFIEDDDGAWGRQLKIHYVNPGSLVAWVRDVIGDAELAGRIGELVAGGQPYGLLVPEIKRLFAERFAQYGEALEPVE